MLSSQMRVALLTTAGILWIAGSMVFDLKEGDGG